MSLGSTPNYLPAGRVLAKVPDFTLNRHEFRNSRLSIQGLATAATEGENAWQWVSLLVTGLVQEARLGHLGTAPINPVRWAAWCRVTLLVSIVGEQAGTISPHAERCLAQGRAGDESRHDDEPLVRTCLRVGLGCTKRTTISSRSRPLVGPSTCHSRS